MENQNILDEPVLEPEIRSRPVMITILCILGFLYVCRNVVLGVSLFRAVDASALSYLLFLAVGNLATVIGLWKMKKWGAYSYFATSLISQIILIVWGGWTILTLVEVLIVSAVILARLNQMD